ncbi:MAG: class I mannose-6-phosphate isomerase [Bacteroidales bacterium]|nr:class I mannose-6-phosphate isomerase [Bacteroidales bacterium]
MRQLYPLKFKPIFKEKIWGGQQIRTKLGMDFGSLPNCGEAWLISGYGNELTVVENGFLTGNNINELVEVYMGELVGDRIFDTYGSEFPLLIKIIDANDWLSLQVHPDDELSAKMQINGGKTEMWYVLEAEKGAELISGFNRNTDKDEYLEKLNNNQLKEILNFETVSRGDVFFIPSGRVHALGPGVLLAEIQQTSDATFRIYDWDRMDASGMTRELHTEAALRALDFEVKSSYKTKYEPGTNQTVRLIDCPYFTSRLVEMNKPVVKNFKELDSFVIYLLAEGNCSLNYSGGKIDLKPGEAVLVPALIDNVGLHPAKKSKLLEIFIA